MLAQEINTNSEQKQDHHNVQISGVTLTSYQSADDIPMQDAHALLNAHVRWAYGEFRKLGTAHFDVSPHVERFFGNLEKVLPPHGAYFLAHDLSGKACGTGALRRVSGDTAEMKHLYVDPDARGTGLGEALVRARIDAARALGFRTILADTFQGNMPMIRLYHRLGFEDTGPHQGATGNITPELAPYLHYFRMNL